MDKYLVSFWDINNLYVDNEIAYWTKVTEYNIKAFERKDIFDSNSRYRIIISITKVEV